MINIGCALPSSVWRIDPMTQQVLILSPFILPTEREEECHLFLWFPTQDHTWEIKSDANAGKLNPRLTSGAETFEVKQAYDGPK